MAIDRNAVIKEAQKLAAKGQYDKAIAEWKKIAKESPNDANIFNTIGDLCLKKNSRPEAVEAYRKAADILAADGFTSKAIALYKKVLNIEPGKIEVHLALGDMHAEKGLTGNALENYKYVADYYSQKKDTARALGIYQKMADLNASNVAFRLKLADMYVKEGMQKEAVRAFLQAANVHIAKNAFQEARQIFEKALALDPNNKDVYHKAGLVYFKEGKFGEACKALKPAFEGDPDNSEVADLYIDALVEADRTAEAVEAYKKLLERQPDQADLREKLCRLYLKQKDYDNAFSEISSLANLKIENKDFEAAEAMLKEFISEASGHVDGRRALSALYKTLGRGSEAAAVLIQAAEILARNGDRDGAKDVLAKALELDPDGAAAKRLLESLESAAPERAPGTAKPQPVRPASAPSTAALSDDPAVSEAIAEADVLVKYGLPTKAIEQLERLAQANPKSIQVRIRLRDLHGDNGNMNKAVSHMLVLADLYSGQGMQDRAEETLQAALGMDPDNSLIRKKLGMTAADGAHAGQGVPVEVPLPEQDVPFEEPAADAPVFDETVLTFDQPAEATDFGFPSTEPEQGFSFAGAGEEVAFAEPAGASAPPEAEEISFDQPFTAPDLPGFEAERAAEEPFEPDQAASAFSPDLSGSEAIREAEAPFERDQAAAAASENIDISEIWGEAEFYYQQGLFEEARKYYRKILEYAPENAEALDRIEEIGREQENVQAFSKLAEAVDGLESYAPSDGSEHGLASSVSDEEAVRSLMQEIAQLKQKAVPQQPVQERAAIEPGQKAPGSGKERRRTEEDFFDLGQELSQAGGPASSAGRKETRSDDFFDLAAELRDELSTVSVPPPSDSSQEQSLDDIFEEFKRGVEQQAIKEDTDTHYNLGIAYKEMGLLDDAIGEFVMTPENEPKYGHSRHMLGLCYMEKGDYQNAIDEIQRALTHLEERGGAESDLLGIFYDLGLAYQGAGNSDSAMTQFQKAYAMDPGYRDAGEKIRELEQGDAISIEQLKDDIEKEISFKFLEEGERIQREEKTRKNEKVRK